MKGYYFEASDKGTVTQIYKKNTRYTIGKRVSLQIAGEENNVGFIYCQICALDKGNLLPRMNDVDVSEITIDMPKSAFKWAQCEECMKWRKVGVGMQWLFPKFFCHNLNRECAEAEDVE